MNIFIKLLSVLDRSQVKKFWALEILVVFSALFETISIISIGSAISILTNEKSIYKNYLLSFLTNFCGIQLQSDEVFFLYFTIVVLIILALSTFLSIVTIWKLSTFAANVGGGLSSKLYTLFLSINYKDFNSIGSSHITKQIATEVTRLTDNVLQPIVQINARIISGLFIFILLFYFNPAASIGAILIFSTAYLLMYYFFKNDLSSNGRKLSEIYQSRYRFLNEAAGAFREIKSFGVKKLFSDRFSESSDEYAKAYSKLNTIYNSPRYVIEFVIYFSLVLLLFKASLNSSNYDLISEVTMFGLASVKLLPIFQQIFAGVSQIKSHRNSLDSIYKDLIHNQFQVEDNSICHDLSVFENLDSSAEIIEMKNVSFSYKVNTPIIEGLSLSIGKLDKVVIVGKSGAGKTTLSDLITGMILPTEGEIIFNGEVISFSNLSHLRSHVSLVTQFPFVISGTIANNVTYSFGKAIDIERIKLVLSQVGLMEFVSTLPNGLDTIVGDGGCSFSGGQLQRIGIARALYRDTPIILFDEPTSSLDPNSEKVIIDLISNLSISKTVITISHSLEVIKNNDRVILMEDGKIIEQGGYDDLICNSEKFKDLLQSFENKI